MHNTPRLHLFSFVGIVCLVTLVLFQAPLLSFALSVADIPRIQGIIQIATLQVLQATLLAALLFFISLFSALILKIFTAALFFLNTLALYYMLSYGIEIDRAMIANIMNTNSRESAELFHPKLLLYVLTLTVLPSILLLRSKISMPRWHWRILSGLAALTFLGAWALATSFTWLWFDQHMTRLGARSLPFSYIVNTARHLGKNALDQRDITLLPAPTFHGAPSRKQVVILVIGEAARADHWAHYGYHRATNPFTTTKDISVFPMGQSCATNTIASTACIVTHEGKDASAYTGFEPIQSYLTRFGVTTLLRTNNSGPPPMQVTQQENAKEIAATCSAAICPSGNLDESLNYGLGAYLGQSEAKRIFVTLHQSGSHGPAYATKYPKAFAKFTPVCDTVQIANCTTEELTNAYDNTLLYTDYLLAELIETLDTLPETDSVLIYVSDHGQSLGENGYYLHGAPMAIAPKEQRIVPFMVWMSDGFKTQRGLTSDRILTAETFPHDFPFHSILGAFGMTSPIYKAQFDIFNLGPDGPKR